MPPKKRRMIMALSRKMLVAMDIPAEKIDEIINAHAETVNALKEERDTFKADASKLESVEKELEKANAKLEEFKAGDWENKYNNLKGEYDTYKTDTETKAVKKAKEAAYKQLLIEAGVSDKRIATIMKVSETTVDGIELDKDGKIKDADKLTESAKTEWADFIVSEGKKGAETPDPPESNGGEGGTRTSRAAQLVAQYNNEHYGKIKED
jgi:transcriptional regulator with XRE-family HTH domain/FtsZ-binding cell division protein ZapB